MSPKCLTTNRLTIFVAAFLFHCGGIALATTSFMTLTPVSGQLRAECRFVPENLQKLGTAPRNEDTNSTCTLDTGSDSTVAPMLQLTSRPDDLLHQMPKNCMKVQMASFSSNQAEFNLSTALACKPFRSEGLIGMDAIGHGRVVFDFPRNKVNFDSNESNDTLNFVFDTGTDNRIFLSGKIGGQIIRILWDTGGGLKSEQHRISGKALELSGVIDKQILQKSPRSFLPLMNLVISNADGSKKSLKLVRCIEDLEIGPIKTKNLIFAVDDLEKGLFGEFVAPGTNMILGYPAMSNYQWIFDFNEKTWSASK